VRPPPQPSPACGGAKGGGRPQPFSSPQTIWRCGCGIHPQYANETVAAAEFRTDEIAVRAQCFAQCRDLKLQILCRYYDARAHPADELFFHDERAICFRQAAGDRRRACRVRPERRRRAAAAVAIGRGNGRIRGPRWRRLPRVTRLRRGGSGFLRGESFGQIFMVIVASRDQIDRGRTARPFRMLPGAAEPRPAPQELRSKACEVLWTEL
jgi:hypothetical protein